MGSANKPPGEPVAPPPTELGADTPQSEFAERKGAGQTARLLMFGLGNERAIDQRSKLRSTTGDGPFAGFTAPRSFP